MRGVVWWCPNIVLGSPWPNGNAMAGPSNNFSSGARQYCPDRMKVRRRADFRCEHDYFQITLRPTPVCKVETID